MEKPKVAIISLTCCEGCQFALMDLGQEFLDLTKYIDLVDMRFLREEAENTFYDITFIEGNPISPADFENIKRIRKRSKYLIMALGNCAAMGGIPKIGNYRGRQKLFEYVYGKLKNVSHPDITTVFAHFKIDFVLPGCPITAGEFIEVIDDLLADKKPVTPQRPVCYECQIRGYECLLQKGEICFGPIILGGCEAICLKNKQGCFGCRGLLKDIKKETIDNLLKILRQKHKEKDIEAVLEVFGVKDRK